MPHSSIVSTCTTFFAITEILPSAHIVYLTRFFWFSQETASVPLNSIARLIVVMQAECISCEIQTEFLYKNARWICQHRYSLLVELFVSSLWVQKFGFSELPGWVVFENSSVWFSALVTIISIEIEKRRLDSGDFGDSSYCGVFWDGEVTGWLLASPFSCFGWGLWFRILTSDSTVVLTVV